jgi:hypothetical protein
MNELNEALEHISSIRRQVAYNTEFHGYGPVTLAATGGIAVLAAGAQAVWLPNPANRVPVYLAIWISSAIVSAALIAVQTVTRSHRMHSGMADEMIHMAVEQFLPAAVAGALLTVVIVGSVPGATWMLPGLWQITFSLGVFSSCRFLPRSMTIAGAWYLFTGLTCIALADGRALAPWTMGVSYGVGQVLVACILFLAAEKGSVEN